MKKPTLRERIEVAVTRDGALAAMQLVSMIGIGAAIGSAETFGMNTAAGLTALAAGANVGLSALVECTNQKQSKKRLLDIYHEEIAALNGKTGQSVTLDDLETPASRSNPAIDSALELFKKRRNFYIGTHAATALILSSVVGVAAFALELVPVLAIAGVAGLLYDQTYKTVKIAGNAIFDIDSERTVTKRIREISDQIGLGGRISTTRVLGVFVEANPELRAQVKEQYGSDYSELTISQKRELVKNLDSAFNLYRLTEDLNTGAVNPTELAFLAYGQHSGVKRRDVAPLPFVGTKDNQSLVCFGANTKNTVNDVVPADLALSQADQHGGHFQRLVRPEPSDLSNAQDASVPINQRLH